MGNKILSELREVISSSKLVKGIKDELVRLDSWMNETTGLGTWRDRAKGTKFESMGHISDDYASTLYAEDDVAGRICEAFPEYVLRRGVTVTVRPDEEDEDSTDAEEDVGPFAAADSMQTQEEMEADVRWEMERLKVIQTVLDARVWANVYGRSAILIGADDGTLDSEDYGALATPLNEDNFDSIKHLTVLEGTQLRIKSRYEDPKDEKFGKPEIYEILPVDKDSKNIFDVHESRLIVFGGMRTSARRRAERGGWDDSLLNKCTAVISQFGISWKTLDHMMTMSTQGIFKMHKYLDALASDSSDLVQQRVQLMDVHRSLVRALLMDADGGEDFRYETFPLAQMKTPIELLMYRLSLCSRTPVTIIMGRSPAGENATGEADWTNFDGQAEAERELVLKPVFNRIVTLLFKAKSGPFKGREPENWDLTFAELRPMTQKEREEIKYMQAQRDHIYYTDTVLLPEEIAVARFGPDSDGDISIDIEARKALYLEEKQNAENLKKQLDASGNNEGDPEANNSGEAGSVQGAESNGDGTVVQGAAQQGKPAGTK